MLMIFYTILFLLELVAFAAFSYWGFYQAKGLVLKIMLAISVPLVVAIFWGMFLSPKAPIALPFTVKFLLQIVVIGLAAVALHFTGKSMLAIVLFVSFIIVKLLIFKLE